MLFGELIRAYMAQDESAVMDIIEAKRRDEWSFFHAMSTRPCTVGNETLAMVPLLPVVPANGADECNGPGRESCLFYHWLCLSLGPFHHIYSVAVFFVKPCANKGNTNFPQAKLSDGSEQAQAG